jgi:hypothetical protein
MAIGVIVENPELSPEQARQIIEHVSSTGPTPPEGARLVLGGPAAPGWRMITVWDSEEALERFFADRLAPAYAEVGLSLESASRTVFEVYMLVAGDLTGVPQPA